jgi:sulfotransferase
MPRSGSTLLQNILGNNPDIYATPTSGLIELLKESRKIYSSSPQFKAQDENQMKSAFLMYCRYGIEGYFNGLTDRKYAIDKSRGWAISYGFLKAFYPNPKIICMVRDLREVVASMEKNYLKYPEKTEFQLEENLKAVNVGERITYWMKTLPLNTLFKLQEVIRRGWGEQMLFIRFEDLVENPDRELRKVYKYLNLPYYQHDFNNIEQVTFEDDKFHGRYGDHKIEKSIKPVPNKAEALLGELICNQLYEKNKWYFEYFNYKK